MTDKKKKEDAIEVFSDKNLIPLTPENIKAYICRDATDMEIAHFLNICQMHQLNPFKREIYLVKYKGSPAVSIVGYETYLKRAERSGKWTGLSYGTTGSITEGNLEAWCEINKKGWDKPLRHVVYYEECVQMKKDYNTGKMVPTQFWDKRPKGQLIKTCISQGMRLAFPDEFAGLPYTQYEPQGDEIIDIVPMGEIEHEPIKEEKEKKPAATKEKPKGPLSKVTKAEKVETAPAIKEEEEEEPEPEEEIEDTGFDLGTDDEEPDEEEESGEVIPEIEVKQKIFEQRIKLICTPKDQGGYGGDLKKLTKDLANVLVKKFPNAKIKEIPDDMSPEQLDFALELLDITISRVEAERKKNKNE